MKLLVGLGNPGKQYERNRHNIGFMAVEEIARVHGFAPWRSRFQGEVCEGLIGGEKCLLLKPLTFMNLSGQSVRLACQFYKIPLRDVFVLHDEIDLAPAKVKVKSGGGSAGHNGLKSISAHIGNDYVRLRLGVGRPQNKGDVAHYVLQDFAKAEQPWLDEVLGVIARRVDVLITGDLDRFMSVIGADLAPAKTEKAAKVDKAAQGQKPTDGAGKKPNEATIGNETKQTTPTEGPLKAALERWRQGKSQKGDE